MKTFTVLIGNSDNGLTQQQWSDFYHTTDRAIRRQALHIHFEGSSASAARYQNACWVFEIDLSEDALETQLMFLRRELSSIASTYKQNSIIFAEWHPAMFLPPIAL